MPIPLNFEISHQIHTSFAFYTVFASNIRKTIRPFWKVKFQSGLVIAQMVDWCIPVASAQIDEKRRFVSNVSRFGGVGI